MGSQPVLASSWKEEVNQRLAAHRSRKGPAALEPADASGGPSPASQRAAEAAARVAARYAKAPSYSEMQAAEARAALRAAEVATRAALEAQVAAQAALDNLEHLHNAEDLAFQPESAAPSELHAPVHAEDQPKSSPTASVLWDEELPKSPAVEDRKATIHSHVPKTSPSRAYQSENARLDSLDGRLADSVQEVPAAQPIPANLIEFPRELVATRRLRPRLTGNRHDALSEMFGQLSIFEVDPSVISVEPPAVEAVPETEDHQWTGPEWSSIQLDDTSEEDTVAAARELRPVETLYVAPFSLRVLANIVDASLIFGVVTGLAAFAAHALHRFPSLKATEVGAALALVVVALAYYGLSFAVAEVTPGMKFAGIALCTFEGECPTHAQIRARYGVMLLSLLPVGLGAAWAIFDDDHLCWHNRISRMYLRECERNAPSDSSAS